MVEVNDPWGTSESVLWHCKDKIDSIMETTRPYAGWEELPVAERRVIEVEQKALFQTKALSGLMNAAIMPLPDTVVPVIDDALRDLLDVAEPTAMLTETIDDLIIMRKTFVENTIDPAQWEQQDGEVGPTEEDE